VDEGEFADFAGDGALARPRGDWLRLGEEDIERTRVHRKTDCAGALPTSCPTTGSMLSALAELILPNAKIVDARRHPTSCCFSGWKQHFARGKTFTLRSQRDRHYYRDYVNLMAHDDAAAPGAVHRSNT